MQILPHIIWVFTQIYIQMENSDSWYNDSLNPLFSYSSHLKYEAFGPSSVSFLSLGFRGLFIHLQHTIGCLQALLLTTNSICYWWTPSFVWHCEKEKLNHLVFSSYIHVSQKVGFFPQVMGYRNYQDAFSQMRWHQSSASMSFFSSVLRVSLKGLNSSPQDWKKPLWSVADMKYRGKLFLHFATAAFSCVWLQIWSTIFLLLTAVLPLAAVIIVLLITWGISINSSVAQERERNTLGEMFCLLNPELQLFSDSLCLLSPPYCLISFNLGFYNADQVKANLKQCLFSNIVQKIYFSHVIIWV